MSSRYVDPASPGIGAVRLAAARARAGRELPQLDLQPRRRLFGLAVELVGVYGQVVVFCLVRERVLDVDLVRARPYGFEVVVAEAMLEQQPRPPRCFRVAEDGDEAASVDEVRRPGS